MTGVPPCRMTDHLFECLHGTVFSQPPIPLDRKGHQLVYFHPFQKHE